MFFGTSITRESFKAHDESKAVAPDYAKNRPTALHRDNFTCQKCFFMVKDIFADSPQLPFWLLALTSKT